MTGGWWPDHEAPEEIPVDRRPAWARWRHALDRAAFDALVDGALAGDAGAAAALQLDREPEGVDGLVYVARELPSTAACATLAADMAPDVGNAGPDRLLGDAAIEASRALRLRCVAASCFHVVEDDPHGRSPFVMWCRRKPLPTVEERADLRAVDRQPHRLLRVVARRGDDVVLEDLIDGGAHAARVVEAPVPVGGEDAGVWLARLVPTASGTVAHLGLALGRAPDPAGLRAWREVRLWRERLVEPATTREDVMRGPAWLARVIDEGR